MRMAAQQLRHQVVHQFVEAEQLLLATELGVEDHLEQHIAELLADLRVVAALDRIDQLVTLFQCVRRDGGEALLEIPRATALGVAQPRHHGEQVGHAVTGFTAHRAFQTGQ